MKFTASRCTARRTGTLGGTVLLALLSALPASAAPRQHRFNASVGYDHAARRGSGNGRELVSDGPGTGFGFYRLPQPYRVAAAIHRDRQAAAVRQTVITDALTNGNGGYGFALPGDSVYGFGNRASYGVFSGSDGYGSPYFAGYYGPGGGTDLGPLGRTYN